MIKTLALAEVRNFAIEILAISLIFFSPLIYGSITLFPLSIVESAGFALIFVFLIAQILEGQVSLIKTKLWLIFIFVFFAIFQFVSLPDSVVNFISPATTLLYKDFGIIPSFTHSLSIYHERGIYSLIQLLSYLAVFIVILNFADTQKKLSRIFMAIIIAGFLYSIYGIIKSLNRQTHQFSTFTVYNHFAAYLEMIIPIAIAYSFTIVSRSKRYLALFLASVMVVALFLSWSRAGRISLILGAILFFLGILIKRKNLGWTLSTIFILILILSIFSGIVGLEPLLKRLDTLTNPYAAFGDRIYILKDSVGIVKDFFICGTGIGAYAEIAQKYKVFFRQTSYTFLYNEPLQLLCETGIIGLLLIVLYLLSSFTHILSIWIKRRDRFVILMTLGCLAGLSSILFHSIFDFVFHIPALALLFFIILALTWRTVYLESVHHNEIVLRKIELSLPKYTRLPLVIGLSLSFIFMQSWIWKRYQAGMIYDRIHKENIGKISGTDAVIEYKKAMKDINKAILLDPMNSQYLKEKGSLFIEIIMRDELQDDLMGVEDFKDRGNLLSAAMTCYQSAIKLNPTRSDYHFQLGRLYALQGKPALMDGEFNKSLLLDPTNKKLKGYIREYSKGQKVGQ